MSIPKCKECESHKVYPYSAGTMNRHWCSAIQVCGIDKNISARDMSTSPKWCPIREKEAELAKKSAKMAINKFNRSLFLKYH